MQAAVPNKTSYCHAPGDPQLASCGRRTGRTGIPPVVTAQASYSANDPRKLTNVANIANIPVGALVEGKGVGREIYVRGEYRRAADHAERAAVRCERHAELHLHPIQVHAGFQRFQPAKPVLDERYRISVQQVLQRHPAGPVGPDLSSAGLFHQSAQGSRDHLDRKRVPGHADRPLSVPVGGGLLDVPDRMSIAINTNANDVKMRNNRATRFRILRVLGGAQRSCSATTSSRATTIPTACVRRGSSVCGPTPTRRSPATTSTTASSNGPTNVIRRRISASGFRSGAEHHRQHLSCCSATWRRGSALSWSSPMEPGIS